MAIIVKKGFTLIEVMIVIAILAILAMIAVAQYSGYLERSKSAATQSLLHELALAQMMAKSFPEYPDYLPVLDDASGIPNLNILSSYGFQPDHNVGFAAVAFELGGQQDFALFAAYNSTGAKVFTYHLGQGGGARPFDSSAACAPFLPNLLIVYSQISPTFLLEAHIKLSVDQSNGTVTAASPY